MSDNTSIFVKYNKQKMGFEVKHMSWDAQNDEGEWADADLYPTESLALKAAVQVHAMLNSSGLPPEYGITPLYDPHNLLPKDQLTLTEWYETQMEVEQ
tara:strand:- start:24630 stop:24923 length:294 start_codon:yes stop_codon:yes gene_type:complete